MWCKYLSVAMLALYISSSGIAEHSHTSRLPKYKESETLTVKIIAQNYSKESTNGHRIIKRFAPRFKFPKPQFPSLPRPTIPFPVFAREPPKGDEGVVPKARKRPRQKPSKSDPKSRTQEDRTLLAAKKAILLKKAIVAKKAFILAKLKKKAILKNKKKLKKLKKKAILAYAVNKASKYKGFTLKAPNIQVSFGAPPLKNKDKYTANSSEDSEDASTYAGSSTSEPEDSASGSDEDDDDDDDLDEDEDKDKKPASNSGNENMNPQSIMQVQTLQQQQQLLQQQQQASMSMMQQLQQQLQMKQQEQLMAQSNAQPNQPQVSQAQQQQPQMQMYQQPPQQSPQQYQQVQGQAIVVTPSPPIMVPVESTESYGSKKGKKKGKKKKKKKKKAYPRPVNLGVKANLYKKFDKLTKKAQNQISSFIQIDIDFFRSGQSGRTSISDWVDPGRFVARTAKVSQNSHESMELYDYVNEIEVPGNFMPAWHVPAWEKEYPSRRGSSKNKACHNRAREGSCVLNPVYILFKNENYS